MANKKTRASKSVETLTHEEATRKNIPTAEHQSLVDEDTATPLQLAYERRNRDLDPQLVWRGKDEQDESDPGSEAGASLTVNAPPLYIQEKVHPKALIDELQRESREREHDAGQMTPDLFSDFNGLPKGADRTDFYQYDANWQNRLILGDSLQVMASLAEREGLRGKVQCIYLDPPYGIKFNSNFQWSTTDRKGTDTDSQSKITREPEQVKAFRDTWRDGIHTYLTYLRDRLTVARNLLHETGSVFVQIGDENVHRVRAVMDEVFGERNSAAIILVKKKGSQKGGGIESINDYILLYTKDASKSKYRQLYQKFQDESEVARDFSKSRMLGALDLTLNELAEQDDVGTLYRVKPLEIERIHEGRFLFTSENITAGGERTNQSHKLTYQGKIFDPGLARGNCWKHTAVSGGREFSGMHRLDVANRLYVGKKQVRYVRYFQDFGRQPISNWWSGFGGASDPVYVVQTNEDVVERCLLMSTDPGDLVLDPTCGAGTTAYVAEQWGRRWITVDTSRVSLALARTRIMGARYPYYLLADSPDGQQKEAEITRGTPSTAPSYRNIAHGFVYERVPHITSALIANNAEIDVIWERFEEQLAPLREKITTEIVGWAEPREAQQSGVGADDGLRSRSAHPTSWLAAYREQRNYTAEVPDTIQEWEVPREPPEDWSGAAKSLVEEFWTRRIERQKEIDASIAAKADSEYLYDKPYEDNKKVRVAGPFTVESISPHRTLGVDENDELIDPAEQVNDEAGEYHPQDFTSMILDNLRTAGVQQAHKDDALHFTALTPWPGEMICAEGHYIEGDDAESASNTTRRAAIFVGPEFGTVGRPDLVDAAREAADADFDVLIACAFNYEAHATEFEKLGRIPVLKARMNADLHMAADLKNTGKGNLFVIFGEPDIDIQETDDNRIQVKVNGVDVFHPNTGEVRSDGPDGIACWFVDTDYDSESFFVRHAYFLGAADPYKSLKTTLKAEINEEAWATLHSDTSRPFDKPKSGRIAVKVINHLGDEVMKVFRA